MKKQNSLKLGLLFLLGITHSAWGQVTVIAAHPNSDVVVRNGSPGTVTLFIDTDLNIGQGELINNAGVLEITGSLAKDPSGRITSTGTELFSGMTDQSVMSPITDSSHLGTVIKKNNGSLYLHASTDMRRLHFATDGLVTLQSLVPSRLTIIQGGTQAVTGHGPVRYVDVGNIHHELVRTIDSIGPVVFPVGSGSTGYMPITYNFVMLGNAAGQQVAVTVTAGSPGTIAYDRSFESGFSGNGPGLCALGNQSQWVTFNHLLDNYWTAHGPDEYLYQVVGSHPQMTAYTTKRMVRSNAQLNAQGNAQSHDWTAEVDSVVGSIADNLCLYSDWTGSAPEIPGGTYRGFGNYAIAESYGSVLPIELLLLHAESYNAATIVISWSTASEINSDGFYLERSLDGVTYHSLVWIDSHTDSYQIQSYSHYDHAVVPGQTYYYRLRQIDNNGAVHYSHVVAATVTVQLPHESLVSVFPIPTKNTLTLRMFHNQNSEILITLIAVSGTRVYAEKKQSPMGYHDFSIPVSHIPSGSYILQIMSNRQTYQKKVVIQ